MRRDKSSKNCDSIESDLVHSQPGIVSDGGLRGLSGDDSRNEIVAGDENKWCQLSNTAPPNHQLETKVGIDYLVFWVYGRWFCKTQTFFRRLDVGKEKARAKNSGIVLTIGGLEFLLERGASGRGSFSCRWHLFHRGVLIGLSNYESNDAKRPLAKIELKGELLTQIGVKNGLELINRCLCALKVGYKKSLVSRIDIKADQFNVPLATYARDFDDDRVITRARKIGTIGTLEKPQTINVGDRKANRVTCRFYDKLAEIASKPDKEAAFLKCVTGGEVPEHCTRVEFEIRREGFKQLGVGSFEDCLGKLVDIVRYLTHGFIRIADQRVDRDHTERADNAVHWNDVRSSMLEFARSYKQSPAKRPEKVPLDPCLLYTSPSPRDS